MSESNLTPKCHINSYLAEFEKDSIRRDVCRDLLPAYESDGRLYCILHCPRIDKNLQTFNAVFDERRNRKESDYRAIFFPNPIEFNHFTFDFPLNFQYAVFASRLFFHSVAFPYAYFGYAIFNSSVFFNGSGIGGFADFFSARFENEASFINTYFKKSTFQYAKFSKIADFTYSRFEEEADFSHAEFNSETNFWLANFESSVSFESAKFHELAKISFGNVSFSGRCNFRKTVFEGYVSFEGNQLNEVFKTNSVLLDLQKAQIENPERISFHTVRLNPSWFINIDPRKFIFTDIKWESQSVKNEISNINENLFEHKIFNAHRLFEIACRQLAFNAEENNRYEEASKFRRMAFEAEWLEKKEQLKSRLNNILNVSENIKQLFGNSNEADLSAPLKEAINIARRFDFLHLFYRVTSYYGESWRLALAILFSILAISAIFYKYSEFYICLPNGKDCNIGYLTWLDAITHSLHTAILQNSEIRKPTGYAELVVVLEKIFAPLQAALLALAIRRKFMR